MKKYYLIFSGIVILIIAGLSISTQVYSSYYKEDSILASEQMIDGAILLPEFTAEQKDLINKDNFDIYELNDLYISDANIEENLEQFSEDDSEDKKNNVSPKDIKNITISKYRVKSGDRLSDIAKKYNLKLTTLLQINNISNPKHLRVGQKLKIPSKDVFIHKVKRGETLWGISRMYGVTSKSILKNNNLSNGSKIYSGQKLYIADAKYIHKKTKSSFFIWPASGRITSPYGRRFHPIYLRYIFHRGLDIGCGYGARIKAARSGKVVFVGYLGGYGRTIMIKHNNGYKSIYAHLSKYYVKKGQWIKVGKVIGRSGSSGKVTGPHLHFEVRKYNRTVNPILYLSKR